MEPLEHVSNDTICGPPQSPRLLLLKRCSRRDEYLRAITHGRECHVCSPCHLNIGNLIHFLPSVLSVYDTLRWPHTQILASQVVIHNTRVGELATSSGPPRLVKLRSPPAHSTRLYRQHLVLHDQGFRGGDIIDRIWPELLLLAWHEHLTSNAPKTAGGFSAWKLQSPSYAFLLVLIFVVHGTEDLAMVRNGLRNVQMQELLSLSSSFSLHLFFSSHARHCSVAWPLAGPDLWMDIPSH